MLERPVMKSVHRLRVLKANFHVIRKKFNGNSSASIMNERLLAAGESILKLSLLFS